ncbi:MAG: hypothetical protein PUF12_08155 [Thermoflexaceae bacterium]|nr:hypothetical protein [Thermoflexaceae bacterium]
MLRKFYVDRLEEQMLPFLNLVENFSKSEDDIVNILDRANEYMTNPLKDIINDFVMDARLYADLEQSFLKVIKRLEKTKLADVFRSLWICSEHDANYAGVIQDAKISVKEYLKFKSIRNAVKNSARVDVAALLMAGILIVRILNSFLSETVLSILISGYIGIGIMVYCGACLLFAGYYLFWR